MNPFRCFNCNKLLGKIEGKAEIKCPKCKTINIKVVEVKIIGNGTFEVISDLHLIEKEK